MLLNEKCNTTRENLVFTSLVFELKYIRITSKKSKNPEDKGREGKTLVNRKAAIFPANLIFTIWPYVAAKYRILIKRAKTGKINRKKKKNWEPNWNERSALGRKSIRIRVKSLWLVFSPGCSGDCGEIHRWFRMEWEICVPGRSNPSSSARQPGGHRRQEWVTPGAGLHQ